MGMREVYFKVQRDCAHTGKILSISFHQYSVSYEVQHFLSTSGVSRMTFFEKIFKTVVQKFEIQCNNLGTWYNLNNLGLCPLSAQTSGGFLLKL